MLTVDFGRFPLGPGDRVLDLGCGQGRHAFEALRRGATVVAADADGGALAEVQGLVAAMVAAGEVPPGGGAAALRTDALALPFADGTFDRVIAAEILEHVPADEAAMAEVVRVTRPGGLVAVTVPRWGPEVVCWALSSAYHEVEGGHVRIYSRGQLLDRLQRSGLEPLASHHAHALHSPYWWLKCAVGVGRDRALPVRLYHQLLVWDIVRRPLVTRIAERALDPVLGKSLVVYLRKPEAARAAA